MSGSMAATDAPWHGPAAMTTPDNPQSRPRMALWRNWRGPPLVLQILLLLLGGLVVAQFVTLLLTVMLPPVPSAQRSLAQVAAALNGVATEDRADRLERVVQAGPPAVNGPGWLTPDAPRRALAGLLGVGEREVRLAFYTPLPFAGTAPARKVALLPDDGATPAAWRVRRGDGRIVFAQAPGGPPPRALFPPALPPGALAQIPPRGRPGSPTVLPPGATAPPQTLPGRAGFPQRDSFPQGLPPGVRVPTETRNGAPLVGGWGPTPRPLIEVDPAGARPGTWLPGDGGAAVPLLLQGAPVVQFPVPGSRAAAGQTGTQFTPPTQGEPSAFGGRGFGGLPAVGGFGGRPYQVPTMPQTPQALTPPRAMIAPQLAIPFEPLPPPVAAVPRPPAIAPLAPAPELAAPAAPPAIVPDAATAAPEIAVATEPSIPLAPRPRGLFGLAPAPFVEGDFVAALKLTDGRWAVVQPAPEPFPNAWQRRVLLWFAVAFAIVAPFGLLFARALVRPLTSFAEAAERLGRDPAAMVGRLDGPAEVGRAARAFNLMQSRLKSFVDDRTAMVGAISHDLRTPLTRLRFRIEEVDDDAVREGMIDEVAEMEAMIASVLSFIRDASTPGARERIDLRLLVEDVVEDAALIGGDVAVAPATSAAMEVEVDPLGMRRLLANLVENAVKYGDRARVRLAVQGSEAVAAVVDDGPGVPDDELERAFEPFYRAANARNSDKSGSGLGLAVCRSIARAHGGDVRLRRSPDGFVAELRVPLALAA